MDESNLKLKEVDKDDQLEITLNSCDLDSQASSLFGGKSTSSKDVNTKGIENSKQITQTSDLESKTGKTQAACICDEDIKSSLQYSLTDSLPPRDRHHLPASSSSTPFSIKTGARPKLPPGSTNVSNQSKIKSKIPSETHPMSTTSGDIADEGSNTTHLQSPLVTVISGSAESSRQSPIMTTIAERAETSKQAPLGNTIAETANQSSYTAVKLTDREIEYGLKNLQKKIDNCKSDKRMSDSFVNFCNSLKELSTNNSYKNTNDWPEKLFDAVCSSMITSFDSVHKDSTSSNEMNKNFIDDKSCACTLEKLHDSTDLYNMGSCPKEDVKTKDKITKCDAIEENKLKCQSKDSNFRNKNENKRKTGNTAEDIQLTIEFDNLQYLSNKDIARNINGDVLKLMSFDGILEKIQTSLSWMTDNTFTEKSKEPPLIPSGSISDCFMTSRWFQPAPYREVEMDVMYSLGVLPRDVVALEQNNDKHPCYVRIRKCKNFENCFIKKIRHPEQEICEGQMVDPTKFRKNTPYYTSLGADQNYTLRSFAKGIGKCAANLGFSGIPPMLQMGPIELLGDVASTSHSKSDIGEIPFHISIDNVPCLKLNFWPNEAKEWLHRSVSWPSFEDRKYLIRLGCHVVAKSPRNVEDKLWRISFSAVEKELVRMFTHQQKCIFYLFRALYYKYIKGIGQMNNDADCENKCNLDSDFSSYHIKTTMFWMCEQHEPTSSIWDEENTFSCLAACLKKLQTSFQDRVLPHFFVRKENLLAGTSTKTLDLASKKLNDMKEHVLLYIPYNISEIQQLSTKYHVCWESGYDLGFTFYYCGATRPSTIELD